MLLQVKLLENSFTHIKPRLDDFGASFYNNLLARHPEFEPLFAKADISTQQKKLVGALALVVENLQNPGLLTEVLKDLGARHVDYGIVAEYYPGFSAVLLETMGEYMGDAWTPEVRDAWADALKNISELMLAGAEDKWRPDST